MKKFIIVIIGLLVSVATSAQVTYTKADSLTICRLLKEAPRKATTLWFARQFHGIPYVAHTLEVNDSEQLVVNTRQLDCTTLVETVTALTICVQQEKRRWEDYLKTLRTLRYRQGVMDGYTSRLHYFTDWIDDKQLMGIVSEIQGPNPPFTALQKVKVGYMSQHPQSYKALKANEALVPIIKRQEQQLTGKTYRYIPKQTIKNTQLLRQTIKDGDIIAITCNKKGLDIAHLGFAVWQKDGLHLLNASSIHHKVVTEPMTIRQYLQKHSTFTGVRIIRIKE
ncbi:MAG: DUF1460 domain-containing protein [Prevotella sp.]|jgi:hypothetical protein|nr:DUF1460 domain-containing protein [Prevotella sp.]MBR1411891.1 DUF1460 domain-containing protein [Prevotella sp.]